MRVTAIDRRRGQQVCLRLDDGQELLLDRRTVEESPYAVGSELDENALAALAEASQTRRAKDYALYLLGLRDYGTGELTRKLREKGYGEQAAATVARMHELRLLDDDAYARGRARECRQRKLYSHRRTVQELCARGIPRDVAQEAVQEVDETENITDLQQALALLQKKRYNVPATDPERQRGMALLARYGYSGEVIRAAWRALAENQPDGEEYVDW